KALVNLKKYTDHTLTEVTEVKKKEYAHRLAQRAEEFGIRLYACCNDYLLSDEVLKASCIDGQGLAGIFNSPMDTRPALTRKECACTRSADIGAYGTCAHGCVYCYANADRNRARETQQRQDPEWNALGLHVSGDPASVSEIQTTTL
ncbi:MAG TPA: DUF1848 family protein, partial [Nitrospirota bacterium]|nr:DUF1848 family protein [Nitrospirota bacterium]